MEVLIIFTAIHQNMQTLQIIKLTHLGKVDNRVMPIYDINVLNCHFPSGLLCE